MTDLTATMSQLTADIRARLEQQHAVQQNQQLANACRNVRTSARRAADYARVVRRMRSQNQATVDAALASAGAILEDLLPTGAEAPIELMGKLGQLQAQFDAIASDAKSLVQGRERALRDTVTRTRTLAQNLRVDEAVAHCADASLALQRLASADPPSVEDFQDTLAAVDKVRADRREMIGTLGRHADRIEEFLNRAGSDGFPLEDLDSELLAALKDHHLDAGLRIQPA